MSDGGSAFPSHGSMGEVNYEGMSLRQWYAGMALPTAMATVMNHAPVSRGDVAEEVAAVCREIADAMIKELAE